MPNWALKWAFRPFLPNCCESDQELCTGVVSWSSADSKRDDEVRGCEFPEPSSGLNSARRRATNDNLRVYTHVHISVVLSVAVLSFEPREGRRDVVVVLGPKPSVNALPRRRRARAACIHKRKSPRRARAGAIRGVVEPGGWILCHHATDAGVIARPSPYPATSAVPNYASVAQSR